jgi:hypothetical protein
LGENLITAIAPHLQHTREAAEMSDRPLGLAIRRIDMGDRRWIGAAPGTITADIGEQLPRFGPSTAGIEHRRRRLVGEELGRTLQDCK